MPFDFLKKKGANGDKKKAPDDGGGKSSAKKGLGLMEFGQAVRSLVPVENKKNAEAKKDKRSLGVKLEDDTGLGKMLRTKGWMERRTQEAQAEIDDQRVEGLLKNHREAFVALMELALATEDVAALDALDSGMPMSEFYGLFLGPKANQEINLPNQKKIREFGEQGQFDRIDPSAIRIQVVINLSNALQANRNNPDFLAAIIARLGSSKASG